MINYYYNCSESSINVSSDPTCIPGFIDPKYQMEHYTLRIFLTNLSFLFTAFEHLQMNKIHSWYLESVKSKNKKKWAMKLFVTE